MLEPGVRFCSPVLLHRPPPRSKSDSHSHSGLPWALSSVPSSHSSSVLSWQIGTGWAAQNCSCPCQGWLTASPASLPSLQTRVPSLSGVIVGGWRESWWAAWLQMPHPLWKAETSKPRVGNFAPFKPAPRRWQVEAGFRQKDLPKSVVFLLLSERTLCLENCELTSVKFLLPSGFSC